MFADSIHLFFRTTALNIYMMHARIGIAVGNVVLPYLLKAGCLPSLVFISLSLTGKIILFSMVVYKFTFIFSFRRINYFAAKY